MSAFGGKADIGRAFPNVCFWPKADIGASRLLLCSLTGNPISSIANPCC